MKEKYRFSSRVAGSIFAGVVAVSGCASTGNVELPDAPESIIDIADAFVTNGSNFRTDPAKIIDADGGTNACVSDRREAVVLEDQEGYLSLGLGDDSNGPWVGLKLERLPSNIRESCEGDKDGIIWVIKSQMTMADTAQAVTVRN